MSNPVYVAGVGMTKFIKPRDLMGYEEMGLEACVKALLDAGITYDSVEQVVAGYVYGDSTSGQRVVYQLGMTGIPVMNVNNNCSTGSTALFMGSQLIKAGVLDCVLCVGFEKMEPGSLGTKWTDRVSPMDKSMQMMFDIEEQSEAGLVCQLFGNAGKAYIEKNKGNPECLDRIAQANHEHSAKNPYSQFRTVYTLDQIKNAPKVHNLTKLHCCPTSDGAAAVVICSEKFIKEHPHLQNQAIEIAGITMATDTPKLFSKDSIELVGSDMTRKAAKEVFRQAKMTPDDVQVVELHDCFSANELVSIDAMGLSKPGGACDFVMNGDHTYGGKYVINPSGGLISKGHPLGATGLAQCSELVWHLRGWADNRAVPNTKACLQHNVGLGGAVVMAVYKRPGFFKEGGQNGKDRLGYNAATEARRISVEDLNKVKAKPYADFMIEDNRIEEIRTDSKL